MEKQAWVQPMAAVEKFVANEYVAACWSVVCDLVGRDAGGGLHRQQFCGDPGHYQIRLNDSGEPYEMYETETDGMGELPCFLYTDSTYTEARNIATVKAGEYIYWTTKYYDLGKNQNNQWLHHGTVSGTTNHS